LHNPSIAAALVTDPALIAGVRVIGLAVAAALALFVIDTAKQIRRHHGRREL
jgi:acid phosphatase family membrane protein YuiD